MISDELVEELQQILKAEYDVDLSFKETSKIGNDMVEIFNVLAKIDFKKKRRQGLI